MFAALAAVSPGAHLPAGLLALVCDKIGIASGTDLLLERLPLLLALICYSWHCWCCNGPRCFFDKERLGAGSQMERHLTAIQQALLRLQRRYAASMRRQLQQQSPSLLSHTTELWRACAQGMTARWLAGGAPPGGGAAGAPVFAETLRSLDEAAAAHRGGGDGSPGGQAGPSDEILGNLMANMMQVRSRPDAASLFRCFSDSDITQVPTGLATMP